MENPNLLMNVHADIISLIFSFIIFEAHDFSGFAKLLLLWERRQPRPYVKFVLEQLNWDLLYEYHQHQMEVTRDQFGGFIRYCVRNNVDQAMFYNSSKNLFRGIDVQHHLQVLSTLSHTHFPSQFSFIFFKAIYRPLEIDFTAQQMVQIINNLHLREIVKQLMNLLADIYFNIVEGNHYLPIYKFCPNARNRDPFNQIDGPPFQEDLWYSLCSRTVEENYREEGEIFGKSLTLQHIWKAECEHCTMQLIVYKIILNAILY